MSVEVSREIPTVLLRLVGLPTLTVKLARPRSRERHEASRCARSGDLLGAVLAVAAVHVDATLVEFARVWCSVAPSALSPSSTSPSTASRTGSWSRPPLVCAALLLVDGVHVELLGGLAVVVLILVLGLLWPASFGMGDVKLALLVVAGLGGVAAQALVLGLVLAAAFGAILVVRHGRSCGRPSAPARPVRRGRRGHAMLA